MKTRGITRGGEVAKGSAKCWHFLMGDSLSEQREKNVGVRQTQLDG